MKPLFLKMQAFGPFAGSETVRFTDLGENPLFLINGPTGAGKTSLLDGITYAMYGETTGDRTGEQMRCDHADAKTETHLCFIFQLADKVYRIERSPTQMVAKLRGEGLTERKATGSIWLLSETAGELPEQWPTKLLVDKKIRELDDYVNQLIGLNAKQFRQVVVLPQGKFRELLTANSTQREEIFASLFQTQRYQWIESAFREKAKELQRQYARVTEDIDGIFAEAEIGANETDENNEVVTRDQQLLHKQEAAAQPMQAAEQQHTEQNQRFLDASRELDRAEQLAKQFHQRNLLLQEQEQLHSQKAAMQVLEKQLLQAQKAEKLQPLWQKVTDFEQQKAATEDALASVKKQAEQAELERTKAQKQFAAAEQAAQQISGLREQIVSLQHALADAEKLQKAKAAQTELQEKESRQSALAKKEGERVAQHEQQQLALEQQLEAAEQAVSEHENTALQLAELNTLLQQRTELNRYTEQLAALSAEQSALQAQLDSAGQALAAAEREEKQAVRGWHLSQAILLSRDLEDGEPCTVCGSLEHPALAHTTSSQQGAAEQVVEQSAVDAAQEHTGKCRSAYSAAEQALLKVTTQCSNLQQRISEITKGLGAAAEQEIPELTAEQRKLQQRVAAQEQQKQQLQMLKQQLRALSTELQQQRTVLQQATSLLQSAQHEAKHNSVQVQELEQQLPEDHRNLADIQERISATSKLLSELEQALEQSRQQREQANQNLSSTTAALQHTQQQHTEIQQRATAAEEAWQQELAASDFATLTAFQQAQLSADDEANSREQVQQWQLAIQRNTTLLEQAEKAIAKQSPPQLEALQQQVSELQHAVNEALKTWQDSRSEWQRLQQIGKRLQEKQQSSAALTEQYQVLGTLADAVAGNNSQRLTLHRFVLSILLDDVLHEASVRLAKMSGGRYLLRRDLEVTDKRSAAGLNLVVDDAYTGRVRPVNTLSGGESFMAALALALGLSDVVQSYAGGIRLETLFIDEGFGSLDEHALDAAIAVLAELRAHGRTIGIISHVRELKERLPDRIDVVRHQTGSTTQLVCS